MIKLNELMLSDILPERLKTDEILALANALDGELQQITKAIEEIVIMPNIRGQPENIVDSLAWQLHVDFYEPLGLDLNQKRALVENSLRWHMHKGTKYVLEDMIQILFFENFKIEEWFEYGGRPYFFRLVSHDVLTSPEQYTDLIRAIYELKNERSWLEGLTFHREAESTTYFGMTGKQSGHFVVDGIGSKSDIDTITLHTGIVGKYTRHFDVAGTFPKASEAQPLSTYSGFAGRRTKCFAVSAEGVVTIVSDNIIKSGMTNRNISTTFIGSSEEMKNGYI